MKILRSVAVVTAALVAAVLLLAAFTVPPRRLSLEPAGPPGAGRPLTVTGVFHVHSLRSDGTGTVDEIAASAARANLQFVILTDHGDGTRQLDPPGYRHGVLCIDGVEISTEGGHYVALGMKPSPYPLGGEPRDVVEDVRRLGGFGVAAHPGSPKPQLRWREWTAPFDGLEWLNADSEWRDEPRTRLARVFVDYLFRGPESLALMLQRPDPVLRRYDALTTRRRVVAMAGHDAHARLGLRSATDPYENGAFVRLPSYQAIFATFAIRVELSARWTSEVGQDAAALLGAIQAGHVYTAIDGLATPATFDFEATSGPYSAREGDVLKTAGPVRLGAAVNGPDGTSMLLLQDGRPLREVRGTRLEEAVEPATATYRVEVRLPNAPGAPPIPWVVSNPIYVGGDFETRTLLTRPPAAVRIPLAVDAAEWHLEHDPRSHGLLSSPVAASPRLSLRYTLASKPAASPFVALARPVPADAISTADRLSFRAGSDRPMRLSVQVRAPNGGAGERWVRSVYLDETAKDVAVFLDEMRPAGATSTYQPDLKKADMILFVVDTVNSRPGTSGTIWLEDVRLERAR